MGIAQAARERATKDTCLLVGGHAVDPWLVGVHFTSKTPSVDPVELHLGLPILIFELHQSGVDVGPDNILAFVSDNLNRHMDEALSGYLTIVRYVVNPPPRRKSLSWFARMFTKPPNWTPPQLKWKWTALADVCISNQAIVIKGFGSEAECVPGPTGI